MLGAEEAGDYFFDCAGDEGVQFFVGAVGFLALGEDEAETVFGEKGRPGRGVGVGLGCVAAACRGWEAELWFVVAFWGWSRGRVEFG